VVDYCIHSHRADDDAPLAAASCMKKRRLAWNWIAQCVVVLACAFALKQYYANATAGQLRWILAPTTGALSSSAAGRSSSNPARLHQRGPKFSDRQFLRGSQFPDHRILDAFVEKAVARSIETSSWDSSQLPP